MPIEIFNLLPQDHTETIREELARGGLKTAFFLETPSGWKAIDSPYEPRGEAARALQPDIGEGSAVLVLGCGSGFFAEELESRGAGTVLLVSTVRALVERTAKRLTQKEEPKTHFQLVASNDAHLAWDEVVKPWLEAHPEYHLVIHPREPHAVPAFFSTLEVLHHAWERGLKRTVGATIKHVLLPGNDGLLERELIRGFEAAGAEVKTIQPFSRHKMSVEQAFELLVRGAPDLVFSTNNQGSDPTGLIPEVCETLGIHWGSWFLDDPRFVLGPDERLGTGRGRMGFAWDRNGLDSWAEIGFFRSHPLPLATDAELFTPGKGDESLDGRVVFVGSPRFTSAPGFFHLLDQNPQASLVVEMLAREIRASRRTPADLRVQEVISSLGLEGSFDPEAKRRLPAYAVQQGNRDYRIEMIRALAPLKPIVFGVGWEGLLPDEIELRGPVDYYRDLPTLYRSDAVHISLTNLQMRSWPNQRVFDVAAAGRVVLMDHLEGLEELLGGAEEGLVFHSPDELRERTRELLASPSLRRQLAEPLHETVLSRHTIHHRVADILDTFK